ncbi:hypothetical protein BC826DRAFT_176683 [Russula brevipes]|nr:hypothetical protein BC826DRAFT_176683 [Russula brevipes]
MRLEEHEDMWCVQSSYRCQGPGCEAGHGHERWAAVTTKRRVVLPTLTLPLSLCRPNLRYPPFLFYSSLHSDTDILHVAFHRIWRSASPSCSRSRTSPRPPHPEPSAAKTENSSLAPPSPPSSRSPTPKLALQIPSPSPTPDQRTNSNSGPLWW